MSKLPNVGTTIFSIMSKMASDYDAINLSQGFPNFPVDENLVRILKETVDGNYHQYAPMQGNTNLLTQIAALIEKNYQRKVSIETELLITAGATQGIFTTIMALVNSGDEVVVLDPCYDCYVPAIVLAGGIPKRIPLSEEFLPDWDRISNAINHRTKLIITNNPHNPSGRVWQENDLQCLEDILGKHEELLVLSDEVYEYISFESAHISANSRPKMKERSIVISSFGKTFHITGWKIGYIVAPNFLMEEIKKVHQFNVFSVNSVAQESLSRYLEITDVSSLGEFYQKKRDLFRKMLSSSKFELLPCEGTYFQTVNYEKISSISDVEFCEVLVKKHGVAAIPISVFNADNNDNHTIRFCFAKDEVTLTKAAEKLCKI